MNIFLIEVWALLKMGCPRRGQIHLTPDEIRRKVLAAINHKVVEYSHYGVWKVRPNQAYAFQSSFNIQPLCGWPIWVATPGLHPT